MSAEALLEKTKAFIANASEEELNSLDYFLNNAKYSEPDWWHHTPKTVQDLLLESRKEPRQAGIPHEEIKKLYPQWSKR